MDRVWIKFPSNEDRIKGLYALATNKTRVDNLWGKFFGIFAEDLHTLKSNQVNYVKASPEEVTQSHRKFHEFWSDGNRKKRDREIERQLKEIESRLKYQSNRSGPKQREMQM